MNIFPFSRTNLNFQTVSNCCCSQKNSTATTSQLYNSSHTEKKPILRSRYSCSTCDSLQDATRYTELRRLPPVLHFSLLRFVFNLATLERKKSKNIITFPRELDMSPFVKDSSTAGSPSATHIYELRGILLHKGPSAYHGHYEAQVYDSEWVCCVTSSE